MARETKQERLAREAAEKAAYEQKRRDEYPYRLMGTLARCSGHKRGLFDLKVQPNAFDVGVYNENYADWDEVIIKNPLEYSEDNWDALTQLANRCTEIEMAIAEKTRQEELRAAALAKLSDEERKALGL